MLKSIVAKINQILRGSALVIFRGYQFFISPLLGQRCRFYPSCSDFAIEAMTHFNFIKASWVIMHRIMRCHPFCQGGYDPLFPQGNCVAPRDKQKA